MSSPHFLSWNSGRNLILINPKFSEDQARFLLEQIHAVENRFQDHCFLLTSGTTSQSIQDLKWVALSRAAIMTSAEAVNRHLESTQNDIWLHALPDFHVGGLGIWARSQLSGATLSKISHWNVDQFCQQIADEKATLTALVPSQLFDLVAQKRVCPPSLRAVIIGGAALSHSLYMEGHKLGWPLLPSYGMSEGCSQLATARATAGMDREMPLQILSHVEIQETKDGRLKMRSESLLTAYIETGSQGPVVVDPKQNGWFYSQDRGIVRGNFVEILGRTEDFVKIGGEGVEMKRLRTILDEVRNELQLKSDLTLVPVPDERLGHVVHLISDFTLNTIHHQKLVTQFNSRVLGFERIRRSHFFEKLPRTELGKLIKSKCLEWIAEQSRSTHTSPN